MSARTWRLWAHDMGPDKDGRYRHIGCRRYVELHQMDYPIVEVILTEEPEGQYWGWLDKKETAPSMVWPARILFAICFPGTPEDCAARGQGEVLRLRIDAA